MMPPSDRCRFAIPASLWKSKTGATRDRFDLIWTRRRILITQTTIKPSRFVTFLIYFARLSMSCWLSTGAELSLITCLNDRRYLSVQNHETKKRTESTAKWQKVSLHKMGIETRWSQIFWWSHSGADVTMPANILHSSCSAVATESAWLLVRWLLGWPVSLLRRIWISLMFCAV